MPTEQDRENNLQHAREVAYQCMLEYGVNFTNYELVAKKSGLGLRTLRRYFRNKVELVCDVMQTIGKERYRETCEAMVATISKDACGLEQLRQIHYRMYDLCKNRRSPWLMLSELELFAYDNRISGEILGQYLTETRNSKKYVKQILLKGMKDGSIRTDIDPDAYTTLLANTYVGMLQRMGASRYAETEQSVAAFNEQVDLHVNAVISLLRTRENR